MIKQFIEKGIAFHSDLSNNAMFSWFSVWTQANKLKVTIKQRKIHQVMKMQIGKANALINQSTVLRRYGLKIKNEKSKNIICGCVYRHPNSDIQTFDNYQK